MLSLPALLFLNPKMGPSEKPLIDRATKQMTVALRVAFPGPATGGMHICSCGAMASNRNCHLESGETTNLLAVHFLAFHRNEVPKEELERVLRLGSWAAIPNETELLSPPRLGPKRYSR